MTLSFDAWSYSRWNTYETCPAKAKFKFIDKLPEPDSDAAARGTAFHTLAEQLAGGAPKQAAVMHAETFRGEFDRKLPAWRPLLNDLKRARARLECELAFTAGWEPTGWFTKGPQAAWLRIKMDAMYRDPKRDALVLVDHKTGKIKPEEHSLQVELYVLGGIIHTAYETDQGLPQPPKIITELWYWDHGKRVTQPHTITQAGFDRLLQTWQQRIRPMFADTRFAPRPGPYCRWCPYSKDAGGPCKF